MKRSKFVMLVAALCALAGLGSCFRSDVDSPTYVSNELRFSASQQYEFDSKATRAASPRLPDVAVLDIAGDEAFDAPLYLHMVSEARQAPTAEEFASAEMQMRGAPVETTNAFISTHGSRGFGLFAYVYRPGAWDAAATTSEYIHNLSVVYRSTGYWSIHDASSDTQYHWPGANYKVRFFAYAPHIGEYYNSQNADNPGPMTIPTTAYTGVPELQFCVMEKNLAATDTNPTTHPDLLVAQTDELPGNTNATQPLTFKHALTAVRFVVGENMPAGTIKKIEFQNVYREATLNMHDMEWSGYTTVGNVALDKEIVIAGTEGEVITADADNFMMLPQTLPSTAMVVVTFVEESGDEILLTGELGGLAWPMGHQVTYTITPKDIVEVSTFTVTTPTVTSFVYTGGWASFSITSYVTRTDRFSGEVTTEAAPWVAEFWDETEQKWTTNRPEMFAAFTARGAGGDATTFGITVAGQNPVYEDNPLAGVASVENVDLSNPDGAGMNTANCYLVNAPGTYLIPLVYGNGIVDNACNHRSYNPGYGTSTSYANMVDYKDDAITSVFIEQSNGVQAAKAVLVYNDEVNLVSVNPEFVTKNITVSDGSNGTVSTSLRYLQIEVPEKYIMPGNAIVAVRDAEGVIIWSWHIWVTAFDLNSASATQTLPTVEDSSGNSYTYELMSENLGWCPGKEVVWKARSTKYRIRQTDTDATKEFTLSQTSYSEVRIGNQPFYQWGRKDPILAHCYSSESNVSTPKPCYPSLEKDHTGESYEYRDTTLTGVTMGLAIKFPHVFYGRTTVEYDWCTSSALDLNRWDGTNTLGVENASGNYNYESSNNDFEVVKTVYDPSPAGYCVPPKCAFRGIDYNISEVGGSYNADIDGHKTGAFIVNSIVFPTTGDRNRKTGAAWYDEGDKVGQYWCTSPVRGLIQTSGSESYNDNYEAAVFFQTRRTAASLSNLAKSSGFAVRCIKEQ